MNDTMFGILIFCLCFEAVFSVMVVTMPVQLNSSYDYSIWMINKAKSENFTFSGKDFSFFNMTDNVVYTLNTTNTETVYPIVGGRNLKIIITHAPVIGNTIQIYHRYGIGFIYNEAMDWYNPEKVLVSYWDSFGHATISDNELDDDYIVQEGTPFYFDVKCLGEGKGFLGNSAKFDIAVYFGFNATAYNTPTEAWDNSDLMMMIGINDINTSANIDSWKLFADIVTFHSLGNIFGENDAISNNLNSLFSAIFWVPIAIIVSLTLVELWSQLKPI